ncbi:MAG: M15 family metallopeptidase, partial [Actinomycetales bacterium]|nr:M15 family metallopeptidase [Actinomycetales bacterium]
GVVTASGWALDPDTTGPIIVQLYVDASDYTMVWADLPRPDVAAVYPSHGPDHGFAISLAVPDGQHRVCLYAVNTGAGASTVLGCAIVGTQPLPACYYGDVPTRFQAYDDWYRTLLDTIYLLPSTYAPGDLVDTGAAGLNSGYSVRGLVVNDLRDMAQAARAAGAPFVVTSAYRSYATQVSTFNYWVSRIGYSAALLTAARPGHSEHQLGTTLDFTSPSGVEPWDYSDWGTSAAGAWLRENAWRYGFVMSYPPIVSPSVTCYTYEPWHFRYVGRQAAAAVHSSGLTLREYLWTTWGG